MGLRIVFSAGADGGVVPEPLQGGLADALDLQQILQGGKGPVLLPVVDDPLGQRRPDAVQRVQLLQPGGVHIHRRRGLRRDGLLRPAAGGHGVPPLLDRLRPAQAQGRQDQQKGRQYRQQKPFGFRYLSCYFHS